MAHTKFFHTVDIGAVIQFARENLVTTPVAGKERDITLADAPREVLVGRLAKRRGHTDPPFTLNPLHLVEPAPANHADLHKCLRLLQEICTKSAARNPATDSQWHAVRSARARVAKRSNQPA